MRTESEIHERYTMLKSGESIIKSTQSEIETTDVIKMLSWVSIDLDNYKVKSALKAYEWYFTNGGCKTEEELQKQLVLLEQEISSNSEAIPKSHIIMKARYLLNCIGYEIARNETLWILGKNDESKTEV